MYNFNTTNAKILHLIEEINPSEQEIITIYLSEISLETDIPNLIKTLNQQNIQFIGGIFPGLVTQEGKADTGVILNKLKLAAPPLLFQNVSAGQLSLPDISSWGTPPPTCLTLVDGLSANIGRLLSFINDNLGNHSNFIGGGAGSLSLEQKPCLFCNEGFFQDAAIVCPILQESTLGVRHGWERLHGPVVATRTEGTIIHELNWQPAFQIYKEVVEADSGKTITTDNFFSIAKGYPFGIFRENREDVIRDPLSVDSNGALICVGEVPQHAVLNIMKGNTEKLIDAARQVVKDCYLQGTSSATHTMVVDCISRTLFLEGDFTKEINALQYQLSLDQNEVPPLEGILSLGEISSLHKGLIEFYNKTIVVGLLH